MDCSRHPVVFLSVAVPCLMSVNTCSIPWLFQSFSAARPMFSCGTWKTIDGVDRDSPTAGKKNFLICLSSSEHCVLDRVVAASGYCKVLLIPVCNDIQASVLVNCRVLSLSVHISSFLEIFSALTVWS